MAFGFLETLGHTFGIGSEPQAPPPNVCEKPPAEQPQGLLGSLTQSVSDFGHGLAQEGLQGLIDPTGMMDRQLAQRELHDRFQIMKPEDMVCEPGKPGSMAGNQVTEEEFEKLAKTYSDVRLGRSDLKIDASTSKDPTKYTAETMNTLGNILETKSGRDLIGTLSKNVNTSDPLHPVHHSTTLVPFLDAKGNPRTDNAQESGDSSAGKGAPFADGSLGAGCDTKIEFSPGSTDLGIDRDDVTLYHEMVHAKHDTYGDTDNADVKASDGVLRELFKGNVMGMMDELRTPDAALKRDADYTDSKGGHLKRYEHQAAGLGLYRDDPTTENRYIAERNLLAGGPGAIPGDGKIPHRDAYTD
jgi:hypothetical protein